MNVTFRLPSTELEEKFVREATDQGTVGLKTHRSVGGLRASIYNAMSYEGCKAPGRLHEGFSGQRTDKQSHKKIKKGIKARFLRRGNRVLI